MEVVGFQAGCYFNLAGEDDDRAVLVYLEKKKKEYFNWEKLLLDDAVDITATRYVREGSTSRW